jgi:hypothetical protein
MQLFSRDMKTSQPSPFDVGLAHIKLCQDLTRTVNPTAQLNAPVAAAVDALPKGSFQQWDRDEEAIEELLVGWMDSGVGDPSAYARYIFSHSILRAALSEGAQGSLPKCAARIAATELETLIVMALGEGDTDFAMLTGHEQLKQFGEMLQDYKILAGAAAWCLLAAKRSPKEDDFEQQINSALQEMQRGKLLNLLELARSQRTYSDADQRTLVQYERIAQAGT